MATLVLTAVGTALGGPIGGALGGLLGQAVDTQLFGPGPRRGPRLDDLKLQTSSYGTQIPRLYGRMRVAGTVIWATELRETEEVEGGGKGGAESIHYNYSCSFAVALSSRPIQSVGRIWADGRLVRGAAGDLKIKTGFRVATGSEGQAADPLIAAIEGQGATPAYRGLALAIFEDMALAEFGNRIPVLTFEVRADAGEVGVGEIVADVTDGLVTTGEETENRCTGFAAFGSDRRAAIERLIEIAPVAAQLADAPSAPVTLLESAAELGWSADGKRYPLRGEWTQDGAASLPAGLAVRYHEPARDFLAGEMRATMPGGAGAIVFDSAAAMLAATAKRWASEALAKRWAGRDRLTLRLPPDFLGLRPGDALDLAWRGGRWLVEEVDIDSFAVIAACRRTGAAGGGALAEAGRANAEPDVPVGVSTLRLFDLPEVGNLGDGQLRLHAAVSAAGAFKAVPLTSSVAGLAGPSGTAPRRARLGVATTRLAAGPTTLMDGISTVEVTLVDDRQILLNADDDALDAGANLCMVGEELVQFGRAEDLGGGRFRLSRLLRGRRGSEWATAGHQAGEPFVMVDLATLFPLGFDATMAGQSVTGFAHGIADDESDPPNATSALGDAANRPLSPCALKIDASGGLSLSWNARSRTNWAWVDETTDPSPGRFKLSIEGSGGAIEMVVDGCLAALTAEQCASLGAGPASIAVVALGARGSSMPLLAHISISGE